MEKLYTYISIVLFFAMMTVSSAYALVEMFHFKHTHDPSSIKCSELVASVGTAPSAVQCCVDCSRNGQCRGVMYDPVAMTCKKVHLQNTTFEEHTCQVDTGAAYYSSEGTVMRISKLKIFPVPVQLHSGYGQLIVVIISAFL